MISLDQVKLLETKVAKAIEYVERIIQEDGAIRERIEQVTSENNALQKKMESYQTRIDELEVLVLRFKEDQGRIEDGILSALDRLNQFEDAIELSLSQKAAVAVKVPAISSKDSAKHAGTGRTTAKAGSKKALVQSSVIPEKAEAAVVASNEGEDIYFEIAQAESVEGDLDASLTDLSSPDNNDKPAAGGELDIF